MNVVIYARYSSDKQTEQSIEGQLKECYAYAKQNNFTIVGEYIDRATSGTSDHRPEFQKMIFDSARKFFQGIIVYQLDRFARNRYDSSHYKHQLKKNGVRVLSARENISEDASGVLMESVLEGMAEYYSVELSQKVKRGMGINAEHGYSTGGNIALGYKTEPIEGINKKRFIVDESTAPIVKRIFEMYADENKTMAEICKHMNERGIKTSLGAEFNKNSLRLLLQNKRYIGIYTYKGEEYPDKIPRIIEDDLFERVQRALVVNKKAPAKNKAIGKDEYILTLRLFCGHCKELMTGWSGTGRGKIIHRYYKCISRAKKKCQKRNVRKQRIEDTIIQICRSTLTDDNIERIANDVIAYNESEQKNNEYLKMLQKTVVENEKQQTNLMNTLKLCEDDSVKRLILVEISQMDKEARELQKQLAIEESRKVNITRREIVFFLKDLQNGDVNDIKYRKTLITVLVDKIYLDDDGRITIILYSGDTTVEFDANLIDDIDRELRANCGRYYTDEVAPPPT